MADSCRPVSRHGRYHTPVRSINTSGPYADDIPSYSTLEYANQDDVYQLKQQTVPLDMDVMERPKTSAGRRNRPKSRMGRPPPEPAPDPEDEENHGRPVSRRGYTPETYQRHDYDEYSRQTLDSQMSSDDSVCSSPPVSPAGRRTSPAHQTMATGLPVSRDGSFGGHGQMSPLNRQQNVLRLDSPGLAPSPQQRLPSAKRYSENFSRNSPIDRFDRSSGDDSSYFRKNRKLSGTKQSYFSRERNMREEPEFGMDSYGEDQPFTHERPPSPSGNLPSARDNYDGYFINDTSDDRHQDYTHRYEQPLPDNSYQQANKKQRYSSQTKSAKKRRRPGSARKKMLTNKSPEGIIEHLPEPATMRPTSSLTRYKLLPAIGKPQPPRRDEASLDSLSLRTQRLEINNDNKHGPGRETTPVHLSSTSHISELPSRPLYRSESDFSDERRSKDISREVTLSSDEPDPRLSTDFPRSQEIGSYDVTMDGIDFTRHKLPSEPTDNDTRILLAVRLLDGSRKQRYFRVTDKLQMVLQFAENSSNCDLSTYDIVRNMPRVVYTNLSVSVGETDLVDRTMLYLEEKES